MDPRIQALADSVRLELKETVDITDEHRDLLEFRLNDALASSNGTPEKMQKISEVVAVGALSSIRNELRQESKISNALTKALDSVKEDIRGIVRSAMTEHIDNCPMRGIEKDSLVLKSDLAASRTSAEDDDGGNTEIFGVKAKAAAYLAKVLDSSPTITGLATLFLIWKIVTALFGSEGAKDLVAKIF